MTDHGLGRLHAPDPRDAAFPMRAALAAQPATRTYRYWNLGPWQGDQGRTSHCVAYSLMHWLQAGPVTNRRVEGGPYLPPGDVYREAQLIDEWAGEEPTYYGTSVRAGCKVLQAKGLVGSYLWGTSLDDVLDAVLAKGPVVMGTDWWTGFFTPDVSGLVKPTGVVEGGHAWMIYGANRTTGMVSCRNSWGAGWGRNGTFRVSFDTLSQLIAAYGEAMLATEHNG